MKACVGDSALFLFPVFIPTTPGFLRSDGLHEVSSISSPSQSLSRTMKQALPGRLDCGVHVAGLMLG